MKVKELLLASLALAVVASFSSGALAADSYWKVVGWDDGGWTWTPYPYFPILEPQDPCVTEPGYGWVSPDSVVGAPEPIHLMVRTTDPQVNQMIPGELFYYNGTDGSGVPILNYDFLVCIPCSGGFELSPLPPCIASDPSGFALNGDAGSTVTADCSQPLLLSTHEVPSPGGTYFLSVQEADANGQVFGVEVKDWMPLNQSPYFFDQTSYDIRTFCNVQDLPLKPGHSYVVTYDTDGPSPATSKLVHIQAGCPSSCEPSWSPTFASQLDGAVKALAVFDGALIAAGDFTLADGVTANHIAKWDGTSWSALESGGIPGTNDSVRALAVYDGALYVGGDFTTAGDVPATAIARWDGSTWSALAGVIKGNPFDFDPDVRALAVFDGKLQVGGRFLSVDNDVMNHIASWDGTAWSDLAGGISLDIDDSVSALTVSGGALYAGGRFTAAGGVPANNIATWDGSTWAALGSGSANGTTADVLALASYGGAVYAGGNFATGIRTWDGSTWSGLGSGIGPFFGEVKALGVYDDGSGLALYAGGNFTTADGNVATNHIARWNGTVWSPLTSGVTATSSWGGVSALAVFDDGAGDALYVGGAFSSAGGNAEQDLAKWIGCGPQIQLWPGLGGGTVGIAGQPTLLGTGALVSGTPVSIGLTNAPPSALMVLWVALAPTPFPALGGTVHAYPYVIQRFFSADATGGFSLSTSWPTGIPSGTGVWFQFIVQDVSVPAGLTLSNGLKPTTP